MIKIARTSNSSSVPGEHQLVYNKNTNELKIGDGSTEFLNLPNIGKPKIEDVISSTDILILPDGSYFCDKTCTNLPNVTNSHATFQPDNYGLLTVTSIGQNRLNNDNTIHKILTYQSGWAYDSGNRNDFLYIGYVYALNSVRWSVLLRNTEYDYLYQLNMDIIDSMPYYEQGTWTPNILVNQISSHIIHSEGTYTVLGDQCTVEGYVIADNSLTNTYMSQTITDTVLLRLGGLPYRQKETHYEDTSIDESWDTDIIVSTSVEWAVNGGLLSNVSIQGGFHKTNSYICENGTHIGGTKMQKYFSRLAASWFRFTYQI